MSFSITFFKKEVKTSLLETLQAKINEIPNPQGKKEAEAVASATADALTALAEGNGDFASAYVSGSVAPGQNAQLSISVTFQTAEQKRQSEEHEALRASVDKAREAEKAQSAVEAQGSQKANTAKKA